jgi:hypothetical protein
MQYNLLDREISFVVPSDIIRESFSGSLITYKKRQFNLACTPNHNIIYKRNLFDPNSPFVREKACKFVNHSRRGIAVGGNYPGGSVIELTPLERLKIAYAADGVVVSSENRTGKKVGYQRILFVLKKQHKIDRLMNLCKCAGITIDELSVSKPGMRKFAVNLPTGHAQKNLSDWVNLSSMTAEYARYFVSEILQWDGYLGDNRQTFCSTNKTDVDLVQAIGLLAGYSTTITLSEDDRKESYKAYYRMSFWNYQFTSSGQGDRIIKCEIPYNGLVYNVSVPTGCFVIRYHNTVHVTGGVV